MAVLTNTTSTKCFVKKKHLVPFFIFTSGQQQEAKQGAVLLTINTSAVFYGSYCKINAHKTQKQADNYDSPP